MDVDPAGCLWITFADGREESYEATKWLSAKSLEGE